MKRLSFIILFVYVINHDSFFNYLHNFCDCELEERVMAWLEGFFVERNISTTSHFWAIQGSLWFHALENQKASCFFLFFPFFYFILGQLNSVRARELVHRAPQVVKSRGEGELPLASREGGVSARKVPHDSLVQRFVRLFLTCRLLTQFIFIYVFLCLKLELFIQKFVLHSITYSY